MDVPAAAGRITLRSSDFDAYLGFGTRTGDAFAALDSNDDGPDGTNAELEVWVEGGTLYTIRANTFEAGESGRYSLTVTNISGR